MDRQTQWRAGIGYCSVVSDVLPADAIKGSEDVKGYGGFLIAESVAPSIAPLLRAAPEMRALLRAFITDDPCAPGDPRMHAAIALMQRMEAEAILEEYRAGRLTREAIIDAHRAGRLMP